MEEEDEEEDEAEVGGYRTQVEEILNNDLNITNEHSSYITNDRSRSILNYESDSDISNENKNVMPEFAC